MEQLNHLAHISPWIGRLWLILKFLWPSFPNFKWSSINCSEIFFKLTCALIMFLSVFQSVLFPVMTLWLVVMETPAVNHHRETGPVVHYPRYKHTSVWIIQTGRQRLTLSSYIELLYTRLWLISCLLYFSIQLSVIFTNGRCSDGWYSWFSNKFVLLLHSFKHNEHDSAWLMQELIQSWHKFQFPCPLMEDRLGEERHYVLT